MSEPLQLGPFELGEKIGEGGMGTVYRARHEETGVDVAIKVITGELGDASLRRFQREVQSHASLVHPGIVYLFEYGSFEEDAANHAGRTFSEGSPYVAMELAERGTLTAHRPLSDWGVVREVIEQTLGALAFAHARGVVHRDLKPENLLVFEADDGTRRIKLADFGVAHALGEEDQRHTETLGSAMGTPHYMAPEQADGEWRKYGPWTDLYALGCLAFQMVCGDPPFSGGRPVTVIFKHVDAERPPLEPRFPVPEGLEEWIHRMMAIDPRDRYRLAADARRALEELVDLAQTEELEAVGDNFETGADEEETTDADASFAETRVDPGLPTMSPDESALGSMETVQSLEGDDGDDLGQSKGASSAQSLDPDPFPGGELPTRPDSNRHEDLPSPLVGTGLGLFDLREPPFVDREEECEHLWRNLRRAYQTDAPQVVLVVGESGTGKSRLVEWLATRAHELGVARLMRAVHTPGGEGPTEGLPGMIRRTVRGQKLDRGDLHDYLLDELPALKDEPVDRDVDARALTELLFPTARETDSLDGPRYQFSSSDQKCALVGRLLRRYGRQRTPLVWLDDGHWGQLSMTWVSHLLESVFDQPAALVAVTLRSEVLAEEPSVRKRIEAWLEHDRCSRLDLEPLAADDHRTFVEQMLPLADELAERVARRTEGNALFATQLVGDLVESRRLTAGSEGFRLTGEHALELPDDIHEVWSRRLERLIADVDEPPENLWHALEMAAALGREVDGGEWRALGDVVGLEQSGRVRDALVGRGLAERTDDGWAFAHGLLVDSLERHARKSDRWGTHHRRCAELLEELYPDRPRETAIRRADHYVEAGVLEAALDALFFDSPLDELTRDIDDIERTKQVLERRDRLLDAREVGDRDPRRLKNAIALERCRRRTGVDPEGTLERLDELKRRAEEEGHFALAANASRQAGLSGRKIGEYDTECEYFDEALELARRSGNERLYSMALECWGWSEFNYGHLDQAERYFSEAQGRVDDENRRATLNRALGWVALSRGDRGRARELFEKTLAQSRERGDRYQEAQCLNGLAELDRFAGDVEGARSHYHEYHTLVREMSLAEWVAMTYSNLAQVELMAGEFETAADYLDEAESRYEAIGQRQKVAQLFQVAKLVRTTGTGEWPEFDDLWRRYEDGWPDDAKLYRDFPWLLEMAGDYAADAGEVERAERAWDLARRLWSQLDDAEAADEVADKLADV